MQYKITKAIDALILAAVIEGGVSDEKLPASRELTNLRKSELMEAISAPCLHQIQEPTPVLVAQPQLHAALFAARGALQHMKEGGKPTQSLLNEAIAAIDSVAVTQAAPAAVAVPDEREAFEAWARWACYEIARADGNAQYESNITEQVWQCWKARAALADTPADHIADAGKMVENVREGAPYDDPAFEKLARELGVWGTAQSAVCAQFWLAATPAAVKRQFTDGTRTLRQDCISAIRDFAGSKPEDGEDWESWFEAAFDLLGSRINTVFDEHSTPAAAAPVVLPETDVAIKDVMELVQSCIDRAVTMHTVPTLGINTIESKLRALLATGGQAQAVKLLAADHSGMKVDYRGLFSQVQRALKRTDPGYAEMLRQLEGHLQELGQRWYAGDTDVVDEILQLYCIERDARKTVGVTETAAPQAQAVGRGEVLVTVSGFTGSGKSAIAGEIEILCRALGLQVEWPNGESEKNMTHADWTAALEQYKPRVRIVEQNIPFVSKKGLSK